MDNDPIVERRELQTSRIVTARTDTGISGASVARRVVVFIFGLIQLLIVLRIALQLFDADRANGIVSAILDASAVFVAPFVGVLQTDALRSSGSVVDIAAIVALIGWTIVELVILAAIGLITGDRGASA